MISVLWDYCLRCAASSNNENMGSITEFIAEDKQIISDLT